jgi:hypothetical protein
MGASLAGMDWVEYSLWGWKGLVAGGFEVEARYWVLRLHAAPSPLSSLWSWGCGVCGWSSLLHLAFRVGCGGVGLFLENCIVDASIL